jgi:hypothetical protein
MSSSSSTARKAADINLRREFFEGRRSRPKRRTTRKIRQAPSLSEEIERSIESADIGSVAERAVIKTHLSLLTDETMWRHHASYSGYTYGELMQLSVRLTPVLHSRMGGFLDVYEREVSALVDAAIADGSIPRHEREACRNIYLYESPIYPDTLEYKPCPLLKAPSE